jgi:hypothetical protein
MELPSESTSTSDMPETGVSIPQSAPVKRAPIIRIIYIIYGFIFFIVLILGGIKFYLSRIVQPQPGKPVSQVVSTKNPVLRTTPQTTSTPRAIPVPIPLIIKTPKSLVGWKTYANLKFKYQVLYPPTWIVQTMDSTQTLPETIGANFRSAANEIPAESGFTIRVQPDPLNLTLSEWLKQNPDNGDLLSGRDRQVKAHLLTINGSNWEIVENNIGFAPTGYVKAGIAHQGNLYFIVLYSQDQETLEQVLSTFKFTD